MISCVFACALYAWIGQTDVRAQRFPFSNRLYRGGWPAQPAVVRGFFGTILVTGSVSLGLMAADPGLTWFSIYGFETGPGAYLRHVLLPSLCYTGAWVYGWLRQREGERTMIPIVPFVRVTILAIATRAARALIRGGAHLTSLEQTGRFKQVRG